LRVDFCVTQVDQVLLELVLVRVRVAVESQKIDFDVGSITIRKLAIATKRKTRSVGVLIGV